MAGARATGRAVVAAVGRTRALVRDHREGVLVAGVGVGLGLGMLPLYWRMCNDYPRALYMGINDYDLHMQTAARIRLYPLRVDAPHFIFHVLAKGSSLVLGHRLGPVVVLSVATAVAYVATYVLFRLPARRLPRMSTGAAIGGSIAFFVLETPVAILLYAHLVSARTRFLTQQTLYSPTWVAALPFSLVTLILLARIIAAGPEPDPDGDARRQRRLVRWLAAVVLVGTIAKPAFALCLVPGLAAYLLITARWPVRRIVGLWAWVAVPAAAVIAWQTWYLTTGVSKLWDDHFVFHPIGGPVFGWRQVGPLYFLPLLWIVLAIWATRGRFLADRLVQLVLWCTCFAVPIFLLFREEGGRGQDGNLGVPSQVCVALLTLLALRALTAETAAWARRRTTEGVRPPLWMACAGLLALPFLAAFGLAYADTMGWLRIHIEWYPFY